MKNKGPTLFIVRQIYYTNKGRAFLDFISFFFFFPPGNSLKAKVYCLAPFHFWGLWRQL